MYRLSASGKGFVVVEDLRADGQRILSAEDVHMRLNETWSGCDVFIDACYSTLGLNGPIFHGHDYDPLYVDAATAVTQWAEVLVLERCARELGFEAAL